MIINPKVVDIAMPYKGLATTQSYKHKPIISGVIIESLDLYTEDSGSFTELYKESQNRFVNFEIKQISCSSILPGAIKAFHLHYKQDDIWFIPPTQTLTVGLLDCRSNSKTLDTSIKYTLGQGKASLLRIPAGVAHGCVNLSNQIVNLIYFTNQEFNIQNPDEHRLDWDYLGKEFWEMTKG